MNILYLHAHDVGRYIQPYGHPVKTPNLQGLAEEGVLFRQAHCGNPTCSPSRACLLTGQAAHSAGMYGLAHRGWNLNDYGQTMMSVLQAEDYHTVLCGQHHIGPTEKSGYTEILNDKGEFHSVTSAAEAFLKREHKKPFFLDVGFFAPHRTAHGSFPMTEAPPDSRYVMPPPTLPDTPETREDFALYAASIESTDKAMGQVLRALEASGQSENTLVICTTDHGIAFPHMKCRLTDHGTGVMLILRGPGGFKGGKVIDSLISHIDVFPTVCDLLEQPYPKWLQGQSFLPLINGDKSNEREAVFAEVNYHAAQEPMRSVRTQRWKYIRHYSKCAQTILPNIDNSLSKTVLYDNGLANQEHPQELLFDLYFDPQETNNLAGSTQHRTTLLELSKRLEDWMQRTKDPLLNDTLPISSTLIDTDPAMYSPNGGIEDRRESLPWSDSLKSQSRYYTLPE